MHRRAQSSVDESELAALLPAEHSKEGAFPPDQSQYTNPRAKQSRWTRPSVVVGLVLIVAVSLSRLQPDIPAHWHSLTSTLSPHEVAQAQPPVKQAVHHQPIKTPLRVGPRESVGLYAGQGCNSSELLDSLARARIRPDGASLRQFEWTSNVLPVDDFIFSYDLPGCPQPHHFTPSEACDLLNAFGGVYIRGDSLMRHLSQGLFITLANSFDIQWSRKGPCAGNQLFTDPKCRYRAKFDARELDQAAKFCVGGKIPPVRYQQLYSWVPEPHPNLKHPLHGARKRDVIDAEGAGEPAGEVMHELVERGPRPPVTAFGNLLQTHYKSFIASLPKKRRTLSPVFLHGTGIHYRWDTRASWGYHIEPFLRTAAAAAARPIPIYSLNPAPGANKPEQFLPDQGPEETQSYNARMKVLLREQAGWHNATEVARGGWPGIDWFNSTDGAASFDGTHYDYQVSFERAQMLLNYLDVVWAEIVELGGLVAR